MAVSLCAVTSRTSSNPVQGEKCKYAGQSVRALPIHILSVGKKRSPAVQLVVDDDTRAQVDDEDKAVMDLVRSDDWVVMLDECGQDIGSEQMAELVADAGYTVRFTSHL